MGAGKSCIGRRLSERLNLPFADADAEIEAAAGCTISDIFALYGEAAFREGERKVMQRLLDGPKKVLATGGGAFMDPETRDLIGGNAIGVWLRADLPTLLRRVKRRNNRPLLKQGDPEEILARLIGERYPVYAEAPVTVESRDVPPERTVDEVVRALRRYLGECGLAQNGAEAQGNPEAAE